MQKGHRLQFHCQQCEADVVFSVLERDSFSEIVECQGCEKKYAFDEELLSQLEQFEALCKQIHASEKILGDTSIAVDVGKHHVLVPFNILLTRLSSVIELKMGEKKVLISFRVEPLKDVPAAVAGYSSQQQLR